MALFSQAGRIARSASVELCWVCVPGATGGMCAAHARRVQDTAQREGRLIVSVR
jgi:hypothetical protein